MYGDQCREFLCWWWGLTECKLTVTYLCTWQKINLNMSAILVTQVWRKKDTWIVETIGKLVRIGPLWWISLRHLVFLAHLEMNLRSTLTFLVGKITDNFIEYWWPWVNTKLYLQGWGTSWWNKRVIIRRILVPNPNRLHNSTSRG